MLNIILLDRMMPDTFMLRTMRLVPMLLLTKIMFDLKPIIIMLPTIIVLSMRFGY